MHEVVRLPAGPAARVYEHGWQSWSPSAAYPAHGAAHRPRSERNKIMGYRPEVTAPDTGFWGEGLLAVDPGDGSPVVIVAAPALADPVPSVRAEIHGGEIVVAANGPVDVCTGPADLEAALKAWALGYATSAGVGTIRQAPTAWCPWYQYFSAVSAADVEENLLAMDDLGLDIEVVQIDDGYQGGIGDWLDWSASFGPLPALIERIRGRGKRAGIWVAPFLAGDRSKLAAEHPDWLLAGPGAGHNWGQRLFALDISHPGAAAYLNEVFGRLRGLGIDFFKIDFLYAGALAGPRYDQELTGVAAYRSGLALIRNAIGPDSYLLGSGAPILPSVSLVDAMRVSPDIDPAYEPADGDLSQPAQRSARLTGRWRAWQHGCWWVNDPDCLIARPAVERREEWAAHVERYGGLLSSSDRLNELDEWGLRTTRRLLAAAARSGSAHPDCPPRG